MSSTAPERTTYSDELSLPAAMMTLPLRKYCTLSLAGKLASVLAGRSAKGGSPRRKSLTSTSSTSVMTRIFPGSVGHSRPPGLAQSATPAPCLPALDAVDGEAAFAHGRARAIDDAFTHQHPTDHPDEGR